MQENNQKDSDHGEGHPKEITIYVNSRPKQETEREVDYGYIVKLAYPEYNPEAGVKYTVTYWRKDDAKHEQSLVAGQSVKLKDGMEFDVRKANKS